MSRRQWCDRPLIVGPYVALCLTETQFRSALKDLDFDGGLEMFPNAHSNGCLHSFSGRDGLAFVLAIRGHEGRNPISLAGLLVHEAVHVWQQYKAYIGERAPSDEFEAYSIQAIAVKLMDRFVELSR